MFYVSMDFLSEINTYNTIPKNKSIRILDFVQLQKRIKQLPSKVSGEADLWRWAALELYKAGIECSDSIMSQL